MIDVFNTQQLLHEIMKKLSGIQKGFRILHHLQINITGKE